MRTLYLLTWCTVALTVVSAHNHTTIALWCWASLALCLTHGRSNLPLHTQASMSVTYTRRQFTPRVHQSGPDHFEAWSDQWLKWGGPGGSAPPRSHLSRPAIVWAPWLNLWSVILCLNNAKLVMFGMDMGFAPTWLREMSPPPASQNHFNPCSDPNIAGSDQVLQRE